MKQALKRIRSSLSFHIIGIWVLMMFLLSGVIGLVGMSAFTDSIKEEYASTTFHMADTASFMVNGNSIDRYLTQGADEEFAATQESLDSYCSKIHVSLLYVIKVDTSDYNHFVSVFNSVENSVDDTSYTPWELGYRRETTNDEYREKYREIYEKRSESATIYRTSELHGLHPHITTMVPIKCSDGHVTAILCIQRPMRELDDAGRPFVITVAISAVLASLIAAAIAAVYLRKHFVKPITKISAEANRFARENTQGEPLGNFSKIREIADLAGSIDKMEADMVRYIDNLTVVTAERERIGAELAVASTIQENSIPQRFPAFPDRSDFDIHASMTPAKEVGGDFYNFYMTDENHLAFVIGDVSGKGIPGALFMMVTNILVSNRTKMGGTPAEILSFVNDNICEHNKADMFVTLWLGILDLSTGRLTASNAGHDDAAVCRADGSFELFKSRHGLVLGAMSGMRYQNFEIDLHKGDKLFLYTDGVPEATDGDVQMFTIDRMLQSLNKYKDQSPQDILKGVKNDVDTFVGDAPQFDDLTMLCIEYKGSDQVERTLTVDADIARLEEITGTAEELIGGACAKSRMQILVAVEEIFVNIAHYAYPDGGGKAQVTFEKSNDTLTVTFRDSGIPYDPLKKPDPDTTLSAEERQIGGLGIFMVKKSMDDISYRYENGHNVLTISKKLN